MRRLVFLVVVFFSSYTAINAQCNLRVSLLTCAPGEELYSTFGHTALRVQDSATAKDVVFNYGTFEFSPDFYSKFIKGKLLYYLSVQDMNGFFIQYQMESRSIIEQELNLSCIEKQELYSALQINARDENRFYLYDFLLDNCTTRAGDMVVRASIDPVSFRDILGEKQLSFRDLIHSYLDAGHQYWSKVGIDLVLGAKIDRFVTNREAMFLPDYLMKGFDNAFVQGQPLVAAKQTILQMPSPVGKGSVFTPFTVFTLVVLIVLLVSFFSKVNLRVFDFIFFTVLGLIGMLLLFMWFATDHRWTVHNWNLLWALPTHLFAAFFILRDKPWLKLYFKYTAFLNLLMLVCWWFLPQEMNSAFIPIVVLIIFRSWQLSKSLSWNKKKSDTRAAESAI